MSDNGHPSRALRDFRGTARRREISAERGLPREGSVAVYEISTDDGWRLEVEATWRGLPVGAPALRPGTRPGIAHDTVGVGDDVELARAVAGAAVEDLRALRTPDLLHLANRARRRRMGGARKVGQDRRGGR